MNDPVDEEVLHGGVANSGAVIRSGRHVLRPSNAHSASVLAALAGLRDIGFDSVPAPVGIDPDGRERPVFVPGDVAIPPFGAWVQTDAALESVAVLMRRLHDPSESLDVAGST